MMTQKKKKEKRNWQRRLINSYLFFCLLHVSTNCIAQSASDLVSCTVHGKILDHQGKAVTNVYIRAHTVQFTNRLLAYFNTAESNSFSLDLTIQKDDTLVLTASHLGYAKGETRIHIDGAADIRTSIILYPRTDTMENVLVRAPQVWVRGDTTFFNIDHFRQGDETKLKDIIKNLPGFKITDEGVLLYQNRPIEKILVEGEEIFADKTGTLLHSFPVHVLKNIQVLEGQADSRLLKGISADNKIYLNLSLKKEKLKAAFGDAELVLASDGRYKTNPVLFSLWGRTKIALISNLTSLASVSDSYAQRELQHEWTNANNQWLIHPGSIQLIPGVHEDRYIRNRQWGSKVQINWPGSKKMKLSTALSYFSDEQKQQVYNQQKLFDLTQFITRRDTGDYWFKPRLFRIDQKLTITPSSDKEWKVNFLVLGDNSRNEQVFRYLLQDSLSTASENLRNQNYSYGLDLEFVKRTSELKALKWTMQFLASSNRQLADGLSPTWAQVFSLPDDTYNFRKSLVNDHAVRVLTGLEWLSKKKLKRWSNGLFAEYEEHRPEHQLSFRDKELSQPETFLDSFSLGGQYRNMSLYGRSRTSFNLMKQPITLSVEYGLSQIGSANQGRKDTWILPRVNGTFESLMKFNSKFRALSFLSLSSQPVDLIRARTVVWPAGFHSFHYNANAGMVRSIPSVRLYSTLMYFSHSSLISSGLSLGYSRYFSSIASSSRYFAFVQTTFDSLVNRPTEHLSISASNSIPLVFIRTLMDLELGVSQSNHLLLSDHDVLNSKFTTGFVNVELKRNWRKKYFIVLKAGWRKIVTAFPERFNMGKIARESFNSEIQHRWLLTKSSTISGNLEWIKNRTAFSNVSECVFLNLGYQYKQPGKAWSFTVKAINVTGESIYRSLENHLFYQRFYSVPLIDRNIQFGFRWEL